MDTTRRVAAAPARRKIVFEPFRGAYRRVGEDARFQPCGAKEALEISGTMEGRYLLAERVRWNSVWQGRTMYAILQGAIVTDTLKPAGRADSGRVTTVTRFFVVGVDTVRTWRSGDCNGMRVP